MQNTHTQNIITSIERNLVNYNKTSFAFTFSPKKLISKNLHEYISLQIQSKIQNIISISKILE